MANFGFKVNDGSAFSNNAEVSIKIQKNEKLSNDQQQSNRDPTETPTNKKKTIDEMAIRLQTIQSISQHLRLKIQNNRKKIKIK
jgi:hypothetical protein